MDNEGASNNELLVQAARQDSEEIIKDIFSQPDSYDINYTDSIGNTALHYAAQFGSLDVLLLLLQQPDIKIDAKNRTERETPLHKAVQYHDDPSVSLEIVKQLLNAGADARIQNKNRQTAVHLVDPENKELKSLLQKSLMAYQVDKGEIVGEDDSDDGEPSSDASDD